MGLLFKNEITQQIITTPSVNPLTGFVSIYPKSDGYYSLTSGGVEKSIQPKIITLSADLTTTVTAATNATGLSIPLAANETWQFDFVLRLGCSNTFGSKLALTFPSGVLQAVLIGIGSSANTINRDILTVSGTLSGTYNNFISTTGWAKITGIIANGATAGNLQLQFASVTSGQTITIYSESSLDAFKIS